MPSGVILTSGSVGATRESLNSVLERHGMEVEKDEKTAEQLAAEAVEAENAEPTREGFESYEEFQGALQDWKEKHADPESETPQELKQRAKKQEEEEPDTERRKPSRVDRKVARRTAELERELADTRARLAALEGKKTEEDPEPEKNPRPVRANFKDDQEYEDALLSWGVDKALSEKEMREAHEAEQSRLQENYDSYRSQVAEVMDEVGEDEWNKAVNQEIPMHTGVQLAIMEQENGAEVTYYLGTHPEYAKKLAEMSPLSAVMEVGRLSERLKTGAPKPGAANGKTSEITKPKPRVPAPVTPVSTAATSSSSTSRDAAQRGDFREFKRAQRAGR